jgi:hypothetical protein
MARVGTDGPSSASREGDDATAQARTAPRLRRGAFMRASEGERFAAAGPMLAL